MKSYVKVAFAVEFCIYHSDTYFPCTMQLYLTVTSLIMQYAEEEPTT